MSHPVRITALAEADIAKAQDWYEIQSVGLGSRFVKAVRKTAVRIAQTPFIYQIALEDARRARVRGYPYAVWYRILEDESVVIACLSHRQDLDLAKKRVLGTVEP